MSAPSRVRRVGLAIFAAAVLGACLVGATPHPAHMTTSPPKLPSLHAGVILHDVGGEALAASPTDDRWAAVEGRRLHLGRGAQLLGTAIAESGTPRGPLAFAPDGKSLSWGAFRVVLGADSSTAQIIAPEPDLLAALAATLGDTTGETEITVGTRSPDDSVRVLVGRTRPSLRPGAPSTPMRAAAIAITRAGSQVLWSGPVHASPSQVALLGDQVALAGPDLLLADAQTGAVRFHSLHPQAGMINALVFSPSGDQLYSAAADGTLAAWSLPAGTRLWSRKLGNEPLRALALDGRGERLAACGWDDTLYTISTREHEQAPASIKLGAHGEGLAFAHAGERLLASLGGARSAIQLCELRLR